MIDLPEVIIPDELMKEASDAGVTSTEIVGIINSCMESENLVYDPTEDTFTCHGDNGNIVLWVKYKKKVSVGSSNSEIEVVDVYYNRTFITSVRMPTASEASRISPHIEPYVEKGLRCIKCDIEMEPMTVNFQYLQQNYHSLGIVCPECGLVFEPKAMIEHLRERIERVLEGK